MADNLTIQSPEFDQIRRETGNSTVGAITLLWDALNSEAARRRQDVRLARERIAPKVLPFDPPADQNNFDLEGASVLLLTGTTNRTFTGFRAPATDQSRIVFIHNVGSATYTLSHASASSDSENRMRFQSGANKSVATDKTVVIMYLNGLWREMSLA